MVLMLLSVLVMSQEIVLLYKVLGIFLLFFCVIWSVLCLPLAVAL